VSGSRSLELIVADPDEGFHLIKENKLNSEYLQDLSQTSDGGNTPPFGKI
jgi:hypothetical protein